MAAQKHQLIAANNHKKFNYQINYNLTKFVDGKHNMSVIVSDN